MAVEDGHTGGADSEVSADDVMATEDSPNEDVKSVCLLRLVSMQANDVEMEEFIDFLMKDKLRLLGMWRLSNCHLRHVGLVMPLQL
ncbi:hypothetical protein GBA52_008196 [Prunus armeniaca]|nr:hypothetical protein GBA52_008196 [Prunus armeniaca]